MMSVAILRRSGLRKPSNILLFGLVIADSMLQLMTINFSEILEYFGPDIKYPDLCGWQYDVGVNYFLVACAIAFYFISTWGQYVNTTIPMVITLERLLAVYMPMTFKKFVTPRTAKISVMFSFIVWLPWSMYYLTVFNVQVQRSEVMDFTSDALHIEDLDVYNIFYYYVSDILSSWVPISFVSIGCLFIAFKVRRTLQERKKLTAKKESVKWSGRTTVTLLTTCAVFSVTHVIYSFGNYFTQDSPSAAYYLQWELLNTALLLNASSNFFVYIATNKRLFIIFKQIVSREPSKASGGGEINLLFQQSVNY
ncbi:G-protein coupled receptor [Biomphalaria glabrata]|nr:G-protein coupled receptor [Biomphalaria glabrata]